MKSLLAFIVCVVALAVPVCVSAQPRGKDIGGLYPIRKDGKIGYIDRKGIVIKPQFDNALNFNDGLARVWIGNAQEYRDKSGKYVWEPTK